MSKITAKNLSYDTTLPPFLARLQANNSSRDGRHEYDVARPKKARNAEEDAEAEPVVFDEETGETLTKEEWETREKGEEVAVAEKAEGETTKDGTDKNTVAAIGLNKKRKVGKVVGGDEDGKVAVPLKTEPGKGEKQIKPTKKAKKIKLSFGDDE